MEEKIGNPNKNPGNPGFFKQKKVFVGIVDPNS
jgi:hypothetical protein